MIFNCPDIRNSRVIDVIRELQDFGCQVDIHDPWGYADGNSAPGNSNGNLRLLLYFKMTAKGAGMLWIGITNVEKGGTSTVGETIGRDLNPRVRGLLANARSP